MNSKEAYLALHLLDHVGPVRLRRLLEVFGRPEAILAASMSQLRQVHGLGEETARSICDWENRVDLVGELQRIQQHPCQWITLEDANYPQALREIYDPPAVLYVQGSIEPCDHLGLAMVGSRRASAYGLESARRLAIQMARAQVSVISGGARGVDGASHQGAMQAGGRTLAVLGSGLDCLYPQTARGLVPSDCRARRPDHFVSFWTSCYSPIVPHAQPDRGRDEPWCDCRGSRLLEWCPYHGPSGP